MVQRNSLFDIKQKIINNSIRINGCWEYSGYKDKDGYPNIKYKGMTHRLNRISYLVFNYKNPGKMFVCHSCDNQKCVNPDHLFLGTAKDNVQDHIKKGLRKFKQESFNICKNKCDIKYHAKGLCKRCYMKKYRTGEG